MNVTTHYRESIGSIFHWQWNDCFYKVYVISIVFFCKSDVFISGSVHLCRRVFTVNGVIRRQSLLLYECLYSPVYVMWLSCSVCHYVRTDCVTRWFQCMTIVNLISLVIPTNDSLTIMICPSYQPFSQMNYTENEKISSRVLSMCILLYL